MISLKYRLLTGLSTISVVSAQDANPSVVDHLDEIVVVANRAEQTLSSLIEPSTVLTGRELMLKMEPTLGETLDGVAGVSATSFGPGASRPILRGLGDDRVRILQNGTSVLDVSNVSPDHAVAFDPLSIRSVEIVRGPAALLYASSTIGGVVNLTDGRIAEERFDQKYPSGKFDFRAGSRDSSLSESAAIKWGAGPLVFHFDAFRRDSENLRIPGYARSAAARLADPQTAEAHGHLPNSFTNSEGAGFGASYIFEKGYLGLAYSGINSSYGTVAEPDVTIGLDQRRWDLRGAVYEPTDWLRELNVKLGYSDYAHTEFEDTETGTVFEIEGYHGRIEFLHEEIAGFQGAFGYEIKSSDFSSAGEEAFLPAVRTKAHSLFFFEEKEIGKMRLQFGARYDHERSDAATTLPFGAGRSRSFDAFSASAGVIYSPVDDYELSFSLAHSQRPPNYVELYADGPHLATGTFEIGDADLGKEEAFALDWSLRKKTGRVTGSVNLFYNRFNDFISAQPTGLVDDEESLPVFAFEAVNAEFYGAELETIFHFLSEEVSSVDRRLDLILGADFVRAKERDSGENLPRIPPFRARAALEYERGPFTARVDGEYAAKQDRYAEFELPTEAYFLLGASLSYQLSQGAVDSTFYVKGVNLTDEEARMSTSFLKEVAPLAGRGIVFGLRAEF